MPELKLAAATTPSLTRQFLALHRAYRALDERMLRFDETVRIRTEDAPESRIPYQEVRDFFHYRDNYVDELDVAAEALAEEIGIDDNADVVMVSNGRCATGSASASSARPRRIRASFAATTRLPRQSCLVATWQNPRARSSWQRSCRISCSPQRSMPCWRRQA